MRSNMMFFKLKTFLVCVKHFLGAAKTRSEGCWKNTLGVEKTPGAQKTPFVWTWVLKTRCGWSVGGCEPFLDMADLWNLALLWDSVLGVYFVCRWSFLRWSCWLISLRTETDLCDFLANHLPEISATNSLGNNWYKLSKIKSFLWNKFGCWQIQIPWSNTKFQN